MTKSELIEKCNFNIILVDKEGSMQFANDAEEDALRDAVVENGKVSGDKYVEEFPAKVVELMQRIDAEDISAEDVLKEIDAVQAEISEYTFCVVIGDFISNSSFNEEKSDENNFVFDVSTDIATDFAEGIETIKDITDDEVGSEGCLVYNFRTGKIVGLSMGMCCIAPPSLFDFTNSKCENFNAKILEYETKVQ